MSCRVIVDLFVDKGVIVTILVFERESVEEAKEDVVAGVLLIELLVVE